jgi:hypothetical protein
VSSIAVAIPESAHFLKRTDVRLAIATAIAVASLMLGIWIGRHQPASIPTDGIPTRSLDSRIP